MREHDSLCICRELAAVDPEGVPCLRCEMVALAEERAQERQQREPEQEHAAQ